jgi:uncharacterized protein involved in exopolysaccharide biosynthesis
MTTSRELERPSRYEPDFDAEQDVDLGRYWRALGERWWLPLAGLLVGALVGYAISLGGSQVYSAQAVVYLGQPTSASGNIQLQSLATNPSSVKAIVLSRSAQNAAASAAGMRVSELQGKVSVLAIAGALTRLGQTPLMAITVRGSAPRKTSEAADSLAGAVTENDAVGGYARGKIKNFQAQIRGDDREIAGIDKQLEQAQGTLGGGASTTEKLIAATAASIALTRRNSLAQDRLQAQQLLSQAQLVEAPRIVTHAAAAKVTARSRRNTVVVAAVIGLLLGALAALAWDALARRRA